MGLILLFSIAAPLNLANERAEFLTKSCPLPEQMFSPSDLEVLKDVFAHSKSEF